MFNTLPVVFVGPSGVGKSSLVDNLIKEFSHQYAYSVSHTTREPRDGELNHVDYHFVSTEEMKRMIDEEKFIEHTSYNGNMYGTSFSAIADLRAYGKNTVLIIDIEGAKSLFKKQIRGVYIFVKPPSMDELRVRLEQRETDSQEEIAKRLEIAKKEMDESSLYLWNITLINDDFDRCYKELKGFLENIGGV